MPERHVSRRLRNAQSAKLSAESLTRQTQSTLLNGSFLWEHGPNIHGAVTLSLAPEVEPSAAPYWEILSDAKLSVPLRHNPQPQKLCSMEKKNKSNERANRDPITGEKGSHPVGTAAGATAGGAAGAAAGIPAGPVGVGVGAAAGAVVGGVAGHAAGEQFNPTSGSDLGRFIDYKVVDPANDKIGTVDAVWEDHTGQPTYLAIRTGWLGLGKAHVIPAHRAEVSERSRTIRVPYTADFVKAAPTFDSAEDITEESETRLRHYFDVGSDRATYNEQYVDQPRRTSAERDDEAKLRLKAEDVKIGKREVEYGGVRLRKVIRTETVNRPVELQREEVVIERVPVEGEVRTGEAEFSNEEIYIPLRREEAVVEKGVHETEEIRVGKRRESDQRDIQETVRREDVEIEKQGGADPGSRDFREGGSTGRSTR